MKSSFRYKIGTQSNILFYFSPNACLIQCSNTTKQVQIKVLELFIVCLKFQQKMTGKMILENQK